MTTPHPQTHAAQEAPLQEAPFFVLLRGGELYMPSPLGVQDVLLGGGTVLRIDAHIDPQPLEALGVRFEVVDASGMIVTPGLIDPHQHVAGAGGEKGFHSRTPEVRLEDLALAGITTVVGVMGADTTGRSLRVLYGKVKELNASGVTAFMYTGAYPVPPPTLSGSVRDDLVLFEEVIGVGELAISDPRSLEPTLDELSHVVGDAMTGGSLGGKVGITHFHTGDGHKRLQCLEDLLQQQECDARYLYPTHMNRTPELVEAGVRLTKRGAWVDMDTVDGGLGNWVRTYQQLGGSLDKLTVSTDTAAEGGAPHKLWRELRGCVHTYGYTLEQILPLATRNTAAALQLQKKGELRPGRDGDVLVLEKGTLELVHVFARGRQLVEYGRMVKQNGK